MNSFNLPEHFVNRDKETREITDGLRKYNSVIVVGPPGIGKTVLARYYASYNPLNFKNVFYFKGIELEFDESKIAVLSIPTTDKQEKLVIIDGLDEIRSTDVRNRIIRTIREGRKYGVKLLITSRPLYVGESVIEAISLTVNLGGLNRKEAYELLQKFFANEKLDSKFNGDVGSIFESLNNSPLGIYSALELLKNKQLTPRELLSLVTEKLNYKNSIIESYNEDKGIILPTPPKIISDVKIINATLVDKVRLNPKLVYEMSSRQFEELVAELFEKDGYKVTLTKETRDGGKDLFIVEHRVIGNFIYYVECKKYSYDYPVGVRMVRELYGTVMADRATAGLLVTSSYFSNPAKEFTEQVKSQMSLVDYSDLKKWIDDIS